MGCESHCLATSSHFDSRIADGDRKTYHQRGPGPTTSRLVRQLRTVTLSGAEVLDIGGGIGVIGLELLDAGIRRVMMVDASLAYLAAAHEEFAARGAADRLATHAGDFAELNPAPTADVVCLDRVVCCYPDYERLLSRAAGSAARVLAFSYPRNRWYVRLSLGLENLIRRLKGDGFRAFVHPAKEMEKVLMKEGLRRRSGERTLFWSIELWARP